MSIDKLIKEELKKFLLEQKIDKAFMADEIIRNFTLNKENLHEQTSTSDASSHGFTRAQMEEYEKSGIYPTPEDFAKEINYLWQSYKGWATDTGIKYSTRGAKIVWRNFMKRPRLTTGSTSGAGVLRPSIRPDLEQKENMIIRKVRKEMESKWCIKEGDTGYVSGDEGGVVINKENVKFLIETLKDKMKEEFPGLKDEDFWPVVEQQHDRAQENTGAIDQIFSIVRNTGSSLKQNGHLCPKEGGKYIKNCAAGKIKLKPNNAELYEPLPEPEAPTRKKTPRQDGHNIVGPGIGPGGAHRSPGGKYYEGKLNSKNTLIEAPPAGNVMTMGDGDYERRGDVPVTASPISRGVASAEEVGVAMAQEDLTRKMGLKILDVEEIEGQAAYRRLRKNDYSSDDIWKDPTQEPHKKMYAWYMWVDRELQEHRNRLMKDKERSVVWYNNREQQADVDYIWDNPCERLGTANLWCIRAEDDSKRQWWYNYQVTQLWRQFEGIYRRNWKSKDLSYLKQDFEVQEYVPKKPATKVIKKIGTCKSNTAETLSDDTLRYLMVSVLNIPFSNPRSSDGKFGVSRGTIGKFPNLREMSLYFSNEFIKGGLDANKIAQFKRWIGESAEWEVEDAKSWFRKTVEVAGEILIWTVPFATLPRLGMAAAAAARWAGLSQRAIAAIGATIKTLDAIEFTLWMGMCVYDWHKTSSVEMDKILQYLRKVLELMPSHQITGFNDFRTNVMRDGTIIDQIKTAESAIKASTQAILIAYTRAMETAGSDEIVGIEVPIHEFPEIITSIELIEKLSPGESDAAKIQEAKIEYKQVRKAIESAIKQYELIKSKTDKKLEVDVKRSDASKIRASSNENLNKNLTDQRLLEKKRSKKKVTRKKSPKITKNFSFGEFKCKDKNKTQVPEEFKPNVKKLARILEKIRIQIGNKGISITSAYRTKEYNSSIGGAKNSQHLTAKAVDFKASDMSAHELYLNVLYLINKKEIPDGGLGYYTNFVHYDIRDSKARWVDREFKGSDKGKAKLAELAKECDKKFKDIKVQEMAPEGADEGSENDGNGPSISSWTFVQAGAATAGMTVPGKLGAVGAGASNCAGKKVISDEASLRKSFSYVLLGGKICDYTTEIENSVSESIWGRVFDAFETTDYKKPSEQSLRDSMRVTQDIKENIWRQVLQTFGPVFKTQAGDSLMRKMKGNIYNSTSAIICDFRIGMLANNKFNDRVNLGEVLNVGAIQPQRGPAKLFWYRSGEETYDRTGQLKIVSQDFRLFANPGAVKPLGGTRLPDRMKKDLNETALRLKEYKEFLDDSRGFFMQDSTTSGSYRSTLVMTRWLIAVIKTFIQKMDTLSGNASTANLVALTAPGEVLSVVGFILARANI